jgi:hypothetical protein
MVDEVRHAPSLLFNYQGKPQNANDRRGVGHNTHSPNRILRRLGSTLNMLEASMVFLNIHIATTHKSKLKKMQQKM